MSESSVPAAVTRPFYLVLLSLVIPAIVVGVVSSLVLFIANGVADQLKNFLWTTIPNAFGIVSDSPMWIVLILTFTGVAVGLVVWRMPGHAGPDPATKGLIEPPLQLKVLPSLLVALILMLAGGVSLGPENPIMAVNTGLIFALGIQLIPAIGASTWVGLSTAGMLGALFGTPVGAALTLSEAPLGDPRQPLFDRLFAPLVAAGAGAITMDALTQGTSSFTLQLQPYPGPQLVDLLTGSIIAVIAALLGLAMIYAFPTVHRAFHRIPNPMLVLVVGGFVLGILGAIGGQITLFKGLDQAKELAQNSGSYGAAGLGLVTIVKLAALLVSTSSSFRGGRIFPSIFIGVAIGLCANALVPSIPQAVAVSCGVLGIVLAVTRQGWLSLFIAAIMVPEASIISILSLTLLPAWLLVTGKPPMQIPEAHTDAEPRSSES